MTRPSIAAPVLAVLAIVLLTPVGCAPPVESLSVELGAPSEKWLAERLDSDGDAALTNEVQLTIVMENRNSFAVRSKPTFFTVANEKVTRIVYTPMREAGDLQKTADSLKELFDSFPEQQREEANQWLREVIAKGDNDADEFTRFSNRFVLPEGTATYIEFRPVSLPGKWYSSVHLYDRNYGKN